MSHSTISLHLIPFNRLRHFIRSPIPRFLVQLKLFRPYIHTYITMGEGKKSGRTPEQQAARDARKAAKAAAAAETSASATTTTAVDTASGASAEPEAEAEAGPSKKSKYNEETYEIDINAPTPLSKAELRAAKRKAKRGEEVDETEKPKKRKKLPEYDPAEADPEAQAQAKRAGAGKEERPPKPKKQNSVWIGNLAFKTTDEQLKAWIEKGVVEMGGETGGVTRVNLPKTPGRGGYSQSKGCVFPTRLQLAVYVGDIARNLS